MRMENVYKQIIIGSVILFFFIGCSQKEHSVKEESYKFFRKELYSIGPKSIAEWPDNYILENCQFEGFVLTNIKIDKDGKSHFKLVYASNEFFKEVFYDALLSIDTSSLKKNKNYLIPISYNVYASSSYYKNCRCENKKTGKPFLGDHIEDIDYVFDTFDFRWVTPTPQINSL